MIQMVRRRSSIATSGACLTIAYVTAICTSSSSTRRLSAGAANETWSPTECETTECIFSTWDAVSLLEPGKKKNRDTHVHYAGAVRLDRYRGMATKFWVVGRAYRPNGAAFRRLCIARVE